MFQTEHLQEKWPSVLEHNDLPEIKDSYRKACNHSNPRKPRKGSS